MENELNVEAEDSASDGSDYCEVDSSDDDDFQEGDDLAEKGLAPCAKEEYTSTSGGPWSCQPTDVNDFDFTQPNAPM